MTSVCASSQVADVLDPTSHGAFPLLARAAGHARAVELRAGDALYLPCGWWHDVRTRRGERSISVSFWAQQPPDKAWQPPFDDDEQELGDEPS